MVSNNAHIGLSPLARGTPLQFGQKLPGLRFIPAGAGNTRFNARSPLTPSVYPRWRGEHLLAFVTFWIIGGLSPLARGTLFSRTVKPLFFRFIPAGAGNTYIEALRKSAAPVYPRWRGEHFSSPAWWDGHLGLSPLARGTLNRYTVGLTTPRFIPAGAGNTYCLT